MELQNPLSIVAAFVVITLVLFGINALAGNHSATPAPTADNTPVSTEKGPLAPELVGISGYINTPPSLTLKSLRGKVVLVDFWTYSCINCIRTQPYLNAWYDAYADKGLVIIGVHTPEFDFEKELANVQDAVTREDIKYPVVLDNDYSTWRAYKNSYWPRKYLIDADGVIRYDHIGEGAYDETEAQIQALLKERDEKIQLASSVTPNVDAQTPDTDFSQVKTPEIYFGYDFIRAPFANEQELVKDESIEFTLPSTTPPNLPALEGTWIIRPEYSELVSDTGKVVLNYSARNVNVVASNAGELRLTLDDVSLSRSIPISEEKLYPVIEGEYGTHTLELDVIGKGFRIYTFTFG